MKSQIYLNICQRPPTPAPSPSTSLPVHPQPQLHLQLQLCLAWSMEQASVAECASCQVIFIARSNLSCTNKPTDKRTDGWTDGGSDWWMDRTKIYITWHHLLPGARLLVVQYSLQRPLSPTPPSSRQVAPCDDDATFARAWSKCCRPVCWP